jgi:molybdate transport system regulatory protein
MNKVRQAKRESPADWSVGVRCWVERNGVVVLGAGRVELLDRIDRTQSIRAAARELKMSYRRAWMLVQSINRGAGEPLIVTATGGKQGGGAILTARGRDLVAYYRQLCRELHEAAGRTAEPARGNKTAKNRSFANGKHERSSN